MKVFITTLISLLLLIVGCWNEKTVTITKDYVINPNWDEVDNNFTFVRMKLKDSSNTIDLKNATNKEIENALVEDSSFLYMASVKYNGEDYSERKVYFNKDNGFAWKNNLHSSSGLKTIGELQIESWYFLVGLSRFRMYYYIYLDTSDSLHVFKVSGITNL